MEIADLVIGKRGTRQVWWWVKNTSCCVAAARKKMVRKKKWKREKKEKGKKKKEEEEEEWSAQGERRESWRINSGRVTAEEKKRKKSQSCMGNVRVWRGTRGVWWVKEKKERIRKNGDWKEREKGPDRKKNGRKGSTGCSNVNWVFADL